MFRNGIAVALGCGLACWSARAEFVLAERGQTPARTIVIPAEPSPTVKYAAEELRDYVKKLTGTELAVSSDGKGVRIVQDLAMEDRFRLRVADGDLVVTGGEKGVLYGVYEILERFGGVVWPVPDQEVVPVAEKLAVPDDFDFSDGPAIEVRSESWAGVAYEPAHATRLRVNGAYAFLNDPKYGRIPYRFDWSLKRCHTMDWLLPPDEFFDKHPEYFCEINGKRTRQFANPCWTNPDAMRIIRERAVAQIRKVRAANPHCRCFGVSQNDGSEGMCQCEKCKAAYAKYDSPMGVVLELVNSIADEIADEYPDVWVQTLSYLFTRRPPKGIVPSKNVMIDFCTADCEFSKPLETSRFPENAAFVRDMAIWKTMAPRIGVWDYTESDLHPHMIHPNLRAIHANLKFFAKSGVADLFLLGAGGLTTDYALKGWLIAKWMWNPDQDFDALVRRFTDAYYGKAAPLAREAIDLTESLPRDERVDPMMMQHDFRDKLISDAFLKQLSDLWGRAADLVKGDRRCRRNVGLQKLCVDATRLQRYVAAGKCGSVYVSRHPESFDRTEFEDMQAIAQLMLKVWDGSDAKKGVPGVRTMHHRYREAVRRVLAARPPTKASDVADIDEDLFDRFPPPWGGVKDDPQAENGRALCINPGGTMWGALKVLVGTAVVDPGVRYRLKVRAKVEREPGRSGGAFNVCVFDYGRKTQTLGDLKVRCEDIADDGYHWYDVGVWTPSVDETIHLWAAPWRGEAPYKAVWIDKYRLERAER